MNPTSINNQLADTLRTLETVVRERDAAMTYAENLTRAMNALADECKCQIGVSGMWVAGQIDKALQSGHEIGTRCQHGVWKADHCYQCAAQPVPAVGTKNVRQEACEILGLPGGYAMVPATPTAAMLRPFFECPPEELDMAWQAMLAIAAAQVKRENSQGHPTDEALTLRGGWTVPMEPMDMLLTIAERRIVPFGTIVYIFEAMRELASPGGCR